MSSLQKFHRRTNNAPSGLVTWPATAIGGGDDAHGYWLGDASTNKLIVAPKSTEVQRAWGTGQQNILRGTNSTTNGLANTNILAAFGSSVTTGHPAAHYCKNLTTGGYNTWYLPAKDECATMYNNRNATPFSTANNLSTTYYWSSTESNGNYVFALVGSNGTFYTGGKSYHYEHFSTRAVRRSTI